MIEANAQLLLIALKMLIAQVRYSVTESVQTFQPI